MRYSHKRPAFFGGVAVLALLLVPALTFLPQPPQPHSVSNATNTDGQSATTLSEQQAEGRSSKQGASSADSKASSNDSKTEDKKSTATNPTPNGSAAGNRSVSSTAASGDNSANCTKCNDNQTTATPEQGVLLLSQYEFSLQQGETLHGAFTARAASGKPIGLVTAAWKEKPDPVSPVYDSDDSVPPQDISKTYDSWNMSLQSFGAAGDYTLQIQASDGDTVYRATITVHVLAV